MKPLYFCGVRLGSPDAAAAIVFVLSFVWGVLGLHFFRDAPWMDAVVATIPWSLQIAAVVFVICLAGNGLYDAWKKRRKSN